MSNNGSLFPQRMVLKGNFSPLLMLVFLPLGLVTIKSGSLKSNQSHCQFLFLNIQLPIAFYSACSLAGSLISFQGSWLSTWLVL